MNKSTINKDPLHDHKVMIKTLAITQILLEQLDELERTSIYSRELKQHSNNYRNFLERHTGKINSAQYQIDGDLFSSIQRAIQQIIDIELVSDEKNV